MVSECQMVIMVLCGEKILREGVREKEGKGGFFILAAWRQARWCFANGF